MLSPAIIQPLVNGEFRTLLHLHANGAEHRIEVISGQIWSDEIDTSKRIRITLDVTMNNEHILLYQNPIWSYF